MLNANTQNSHVLKCNTQQMVTEEYKLNTKTSFSEVYVTM